ncbi:hypothetical protein [Alicyclobacillus ferrooxydans]|uniref:hypothetical protein n=1 Tax=Alicyclobacillus ferrooxydans TaxID=471514 RepID=UPI000ADD188E|nr:hypothetical protein [Alicyclobacillus ferrooxydans]
MERPSPMYSSLVAHGTPYTYNRINHLNITAKMGKSKRVAADKRVGDGVSPAGTMRGMGP